MSETLEKQLVDFWLRTDKTKEEVHQSCEQLGKVLSGPQEGKNRVASELLEIARDRKVRMSIRIFALGNLASHSYLLNICGSDKAAKTLIEIFHSNYPPDRLMSEGLLADSALEDPCSARGQEAVFIQEILNTLYFVQYVEARKLISERIEPFAGKRMATRLERLLERHRELIRRKGVSER